MIRRVRHSLGLLGRILAILLLTVGVEFGASTLLYERASELSLREDEARRLAEHLVIARRLMTQRDWAERPEMARELTTDRYQIRWAPALQPPPPLAAELSRMRRQIIAWEPELARSELRLNLASPGRESTVTGGLRLSDGTWLYFRAHELAQSWGLAFGRILIALVPAILFLLLASLLIRKTLSPLRKLAHATERIGVGDEIHFAESGTVEVRHLIRAFNIMQSRIHRLIAERTEALAAVGHDLRTPLARLQLRVDGLERSDARAAMGSDVAEMEAMVASLLAFLGGERDFEAVERIDLAALAATIADDAADGGRDVRYVGPDSLELSLRPIEMRRAVDNLIANGLHYGQSVTLSLVRETEFARLIVEDDGPGIPEDRLEEALRPFTRLDSSRGRNTRGLGLGLAIVARAVDRAGGTLTLSNRATGGLRAEIGLPITA